MTARDTLWRDHQRTRWLRPDAHRWMRPDAGRFFKPGIALTSVFPSLDAKYSPSQPRVPAGNPRGGQWTRDRGGGGGSPGFGGGFAFGGEGDIAFDAEGIDLGSLAFDDSGDAGGIASIFDGIDLGDNGRSGEGSVPSFLDLLRDRDDAQVQLAQSNGGPLDKYGEPYYQRGGHHEMPRGVYEKWDLPPETRSVFNRGTTGPLPEGSIRTSPEGIPMGNFWDGPGGAHKTYNTAVEELSRDYIEKNGIDLKKMTPDQARDLLKEIKDSDDPRIRNFNDALRTLRRVFRLRTGRSE